MTVLQAWEIYKMFWNTRYIQTSVSTWLLWTLLDTAHRMNIEYLLNTGKLVNTIHKMTYDNFGNLHNFSNWQQEDKATTDLAWRQRKFLQNRRLQMLDHQRHLKWISTSAIVWSHKEDGRHQYLQTVEIIQHILIGITQLQSIFDILEIFVCAPTFSGWGKWATWAGHWIPRLMRRW